MEQSAQMNISKDHNTKTLKLKDSINIKTENNLNLQKNR